MNEQDDIKIVLEQIRDNLETMRENQEKQIVIANEQLERARNQVEESLQLQREAVGKQQAFMRFGAPLILICVAYLVYVFFKFLI